ncbi:hypothetical protein [Leifsonia xyli]|nr:hypothetical protein [Leifsonia xyli]
MSVSGRIVTCERDDRLWVDVREAVLGRLDQYARGSLTFEWRMRIAEEAARFVEDMVGELLDVDPDW